MPHFNILGESENATVVAEYKPIKAQSNLFQSEGDLEKEFIEELKKQSYEYFPFYKEKDLIFNLRKNIEKLNNISFSDNEWKRFFDNEIANPNFSVNDKIAKIQEEGRINFKFDNNECKNIKFIDKNNIYNNYLQVINQYVNDNENYKNRYDVTILVNGLPLVHIELKRRGVAIREAFNQINRYQKESFWMGCGLFDYIQIFVISNGTETKYYSNSVRLNYIKNSENKIKKERTSHSFEFTSFWADANNKPILDLIDFTRTFFCKRTLLNIITKYCVFTVEKCLLVMRPYQIVAVERIINRIKIATNYKKYGSVAGGGYIWHATGSGKTLTSFKASTIISKMNEIDKVIFVVDRKDLDFQTTREYNKYEKGAVNHNKSTKILQEQLEDNDCKIIVTTIQKLSKFISNNKEHEIYYQHIVMIFDECHRSQFGEMHKKIINAFKKYHIFGFTGTPIFIVDSENLKKGERTTEKIFGDQLHCYTFIDAINDKNTLPFNFKTLKTMYAKKNINDEKVRDIDRESAYLDSKRISNITKYIIDNFDKNTYRNENKMLGFNSIFATSSIEAAKLYYSEFKKQLIEKHKNLKIGIIYSFTDDKKNEIDDNLFEEENIENIEKLDSSSKKFLEKAIQDYNEIFSGNYNIRKFQNYYSDISEKTQKRELDILIVVNMFLTGFNATTLNTLWVDKELKMHGLIQAISRTNRIFNSIKKFGNIVCFRNLEKNIAQAFKIFGNKDIKNIIFMKGFKDYYYGYKDDNGNAIEIGYVNLYKKLINEFPLSSWSIIGEQNKKEFIKLFNEILKIDDLLLPYDEFNDKTRLLAGREFQDYKSHYFDIREEFITKKDNDIKNINDDLVFEMELIKQEYVGIDKILEYIKENLNSCYKNEKSLNIFKNNIERDINSSFELRSKKNLIEAFVNDNINNINIDVEDTWKHYINKKKEEEIEKIIKSENLKEFEAKKIINDCLENGGIESSGVDIEKILPPISMFSDERFKKKEIIINKIKTFLELFLFT